MIDSSIKLSNNFKLEELLFSTTAQRHPDILEEQYNPADNVVSNLAYLCSTCLQPIRDTFRFPIRINSGYRCESLNNLVGSTNRSQHLHGQAVDCVVSDRFLSHPRTENIRFKIEQRILDVTGKKVRDNVNANFYLFAYICLRKEKFDIDQVIHEYGKSAGQPAWVHISSSPSPSQKGQILGFGKHFEGNIDRPDVLAALNYGT